MNIKASDNQFPRVLWDSATSDDTAPAAGMVTIYAKADGILYGKDSDDVEFMLAAMIPGDFSPLAAGDTLFWTGAHFTNAATDALVIGYVPGALGALPGVGEGKLLSIVAGNPQWIDPP